MLADANHQKESYFNLIKDTDEDFSLKRDRNRQQIECRRGCSSCCSPTLTVGPAEAQMLKNQLRADPPLIERMQKLEAENPHKGTRCKFLTKAGDCGIYEIRPVMCRAFGVPWKYRFSELKVETGVCELNFKTLPLNQLVDADFILTNRPAQILADLSVTLVGVKEASKRVPLSLMGIGIGE